MRDINDKKQIQEQAEEEKLFIAQMETLKRVPEFDNYLKEIRSLAKAVLTKLVNVKPLTDEDVKKLLYYQAQLDLIFSIYGITRDQLVEEVSNEEFDS